MTMEVEKRKLLVTVEMQTAEGRQAAGIVECEGKCDGSLVPDIVEVQVQHFELLAPE